MTPSWCLRINFTEHGEQGPFWSMSNIKDTRKREREKERREEEGIAECVSLWCVFCSSIHTH